MSKFKKSESGITLIALVVIIVVMLIIASISLYEGTQLIDKAKVQTLETNMLTIKAKAKAYAEEVDAQTWTENEESSRVDERKAIFADKYKMQSTQIIDEIMPQVHSEINPSNYEAYIISANTLDKMGLQDIEEDLNEGDYIVVYDSNNYKEMDVIYTRGITYNKGVYYTLSELLSVLGEE